MAIVTPAQTGSLPQAINPVIKKAFYDQWEVVKPEVGMLYNESDQQVYNQYEETFFGLASYPEVPEGQTYTLDTPIQGYQTIFTPRTYGVDVQVTSQMQRYDLFNITTAKGLGKKLADAAAVKVGQLAASVLNGGFTTPASDVAAYGDAKNLFSISHPRADGGTAQSNASASSLTLSDPNVDTLLVQLIQQKDDRGNPLMMVPAKIVVPSNLLKKAQIITGSDKRSGTADNDLNVYKDMNMYFGGSLDVVHDRYLDTDQGGSATAWYIIARNNGLEWKWGFRPRVITSNLTEGFRNNSIFNKGDFEASRGWATWTGTVGSKGDGTTYSS